jgi:hypothetical protein
VKSRWLVLAASFVLVCSAAPFWAQVSGVRSDYQKEQQITKVETDPLFFGNEPDHLLAIQLVGRYNGQEPTSSPTVEVRVMSFSKVPLYKKDKDRALSVLASDIELSLGASTVTVYNGDTTSSVDTFTASDSSMLPVQLHIPQGALIKSGGTMAGTIMELLSYAPKPDAFLKSARAARMNFRLGTSTIGPNDRQLSIIHRFVEMLTPKTPSQ